LRNNEGRTVMLVRGGLSADQIEHHIAKIDGTRFHYKF
jgi:hypothetical protein